ncbi:MAG: hypothetical protein EAX90_15765 [Candidatus Heimdallarchaeota archaeon]|nr:hypothetical protein [Candidatus Heimdallarchaeota archaeon]
MIRYSKKRKTINETPAYENKITESKSLLLKETNRKTIPKINVNKKITKFTREIRMLILILSSNVLTNIFPSNNHSSNE